MSKWKLPEGGLPLVGLCNTYQEQRDEALEQLERVVGDARAWSQLLHWASLLNAEALLDKMRAGAWDYAGLTKLPTDTEVYSLGDMRDTINKLVDKVNAL